MQEKSKIWYKIMHIFAKIGSIVYQMCHFLHTFGKVLRVFLQQSYILHLSIVHQSTNDSPCMDERPTTKFLIFN